MVDVSTAQARQPLGITTLLGDSFAIFFGNFFKVYLLAFGPTLIGLILSGALISGSALWQALLFPTSTEPALRSPYFWWSLSSSLSMPSRLPCLFNSLTTQK